MTIHCFGYKPSKEVTTLQINEGLFGSETKTGN